MSQGLTDRDFVERWFQARAEHLGLPETSIRVATVQPMSRGVSRQTWSVTVEQRVDGGDPRVSQLLVRRDHPAGSIIPTTLWAEYDVYRRLGGSAVPVADVLWFEDDADWMPDGRPAYVRRRVEGDWYLPVLADETTEHDGERIALSKEHIDKLALVHGVDWKARGFDEVFTPPTSAGTCALELIDECLARLADYGAEPSPVLAEAVLGLRLNAPDDCPGLVLCKGTNGHGEEVWSDGRIVAMSDWELAAIGDPAYDFAQCQELIPEIVRDGHRLWGLAEALDYYKSRSGNSVSVERVEYYRELYGLLQYVYTQHVSSIVRAMERPPLRFMWTATEVAFRSELRLAKPYVGDLMTEASA